MPARDKRSSLLIKLVNYGCKEFYSIGPWCLRSQNNLPSWKCLIWNKWNNLHFFGNHCGSVAVLDYEWRTKRSRVRSPARAEIMCNSLMFPMGKVSRWACIFLLMITWASLCNHLIFILQSYHHFMINYLLIILISQIFIWSP